MPWMRNLMFYAFIRFASFFWEMELNETGVMGIQELSFLLLCKSAVKFYSSIKSVISFKLDKKQKLTANFYPLQLLSNF